MRQLALLSIIVAIVACLSVAGAEQVVNRRIVPGRVFISIKPGAISIPRGIEGLMFDVVSDSALQGLFPKWRYLGPLMVQATVTNNQFSTVTDSTQLTGISTSLNALLTTMSDLKVWLLVKGSPSAVPGDTVFWDTVTQSYKSFPDMSGYFALSFISELSVDSAVSLLEKVPGVIGAGSFPIPAVDGN